MKIKPSLIDTLSYISREVKKQTPLAYEEKVRNGAILALKKKIAGILISGNTDGAYGVYNAKNTEKTPEALADYLDMTDAIGADTLRKIVFNYGGDENVMGYCRLYLSKKDLIAFGDVRGTNEKKAIYEITPDGDQPQHRHYQRRRLDCSVHDLQRRNGLHLRNRYNCRCIHDHLR